MRTARAPVPAAVRGAAIAMLLISVVACSAIQPGSSAEVDAETSVGAGAGTAHPASRISPVPPSVEPLPSLDMPPDAMLAAEGGDPVVGQLGSYTWGSGGSDSPWLPGASVAVGAGEPLAVTVAGEVPVEAWTARLARADAADDSDARQVGEGGGVIALVAPDAGAWTVQVLVHFQGGGSASYAWRLEVS